jgi:hypothetical protein
MNEKRQRHDDYILTCESESAMSNAKGVEMNRTVEAHLSEVMRRHVR